MDNPFVTKGYAGPEYFTAAVRSLLDKDLITEDKGAYMVYDPFFAHWLRRDWI